MAISTLQIFRQGVNGILDQQSKLISTQQQLSSGKRILSPADDPIGTTQVIRLTETKRITDQYQSNIIQARNRLGAEEVVLTSATDVLQRARELSVRSLNATNSASDRAATAKEVRQLLDEMISLGNRKDGNGDYLFAGSKVKLTPFSSNGAGVFSYAGDQQQRRIQVASDRLIADGDSGLDVFMKVPAGAGGFEDVFSTLNNFVTELESNSPQASTLDQLDKALVHVLTVQSAVGARHNALDNQEGINDSLIFQIQITQSSIEDLDFTKAAALLSQQTITLQAALQAFTRVQNLSLFNFL